MPEKTLNRNSAEAFEELLSHESSRTERYWAVADEHSIYPGTVSYSRLNAIKKFRRDNEEYESWKACKKAGYDTVQIKVSYFWEAPTDGK